MSALVVLQTGCVGYHFGDISKSYCGSTSEEFRGQIKATLNEQGVSVGFDYCSGVGLVDALITREHEKDATVRQ